MPNWVDDFRKDLRQTIRGLLANPLFACVAVLTLALGIGANTAIFSVMNAVVLKTLPIADPERVFSLRTEPGQPDGAGNTGNSDSSFSLYVFDQLRQQKQVFSDVLAYVPMGFNKVAVRAGNVNEEAAGEMVSGNYFNALGVQPVCGRLLSPSDELNHTAVAVLGYGYWNRSFQHDCSVVGKTIFIKGVPFTVAGVTAQRFLGLGGNQVDVWVPLQTRPDFNAWGSQGENYYASPNWWCVLLAARLAPGMTAQRAEAASAPTFSQAAYAHLGGKPGPGQRAPVLRLAEMRGLGGYRDAYRKPLTILLVMVGAILLIACGNISMLLAARNAARNREFSIRLALGGSRPRLLRQLLVESFVLVAAGALLGCMFALAATNALAHWSAMDASLLPDPRVLLFTLAISLLAGFVFGLAPLLRIGRLSVGEVLKTSAATAFRATSTVRMGRITAAFQVSLCLVLLAGTALLVRTLRNLENVDLGFRGSGLLVFGVNPHIEAHADDRTKAFYRNLAAQLHALPEVESVTFMENRIGSGWSNNTSVSLDGKNPHPGQFSPMRWNAVGPAYFRTLGVPLRAGREFEDSDGKDSAKVAVVNTTFAKKYLGGRSPLGHTVSMDPKIGFTIVGVAADSKYTEVREQETPIAYFPYMQLPNTGAMHAELRTHGNPKLLLPRVRQILTGFAPDLAPLQPMTQVEQFDQTITGDRLVARLAIFFGFLAVTLVATGLYATIAYNVTRRTSELGIRVALGARRSGVLWMIVGEGLQLCAIGLLIGLPLTFAATRLLASLLYGLEPNDPLSFAAAALTIVLVTVAACIIPARRAASVNPVTALRHE